MEPSDLVHTGQRVALVMAAGVTGPTLAPSLSRRSWKDQGLITGLATGTHYLVTMAAQDLLDVMAHSTARTLPFPEAWPDDRRRMTSALVTELVATPLGLGAAAYLDHTGVSTPTKGLMRQAALASGCDRPVWVGTHRRHRGRPPARPSAGRRRSTGATAPVDTGRSAGVRRHRASSSVDG